MQETATQKQAKGVCTLICSFKPMRGIEPDEAIRHPPFSDAVAASRFILLEACAAIDRFPVLDRALLTTW